MPRLDPEIAQLSRYIDLETHEQFGKTAIVDDAERRHVISGFIKRRLQQAEKLKDTLPQRRLRKSAIAECLQAIKRREDDCYCPKTLIQGATKGVKGLCTPCQRAQEALRLWIRVEQLINERLELQRSYFTAICTANKDVASVAPLPEAPPLEPGTVIAALQASREMDDTDNAGHAANKFG
jgi:hypothetical protein